MSAEGLFSHTISLVLYCSYHYNVFVPVSIACWNHGSVSVPVSISVSNIFISLQCRFVEKHSIPPMNVASLLVVSFCVGILQPLWG